LNAYAKLLSANDIAQQAEASDERIKSGKAKSLLDGIPVTIKANIAVGRWWELPTACSAILGNGNADNTRVDSNDVYESDVARILLKECGAVLIGITNMDEFGMGSLGTNNVRRTEHCVTGEHQYLPTYNPLPWMRRISKFLGRHNKNNLDEFFSNQILDSTSRNPHCLRDDALQELLDEVEYWTSSSNDTPNKSQSPLLSPGGSSSGAAAATSHGSSLLSIGTDTGGSLRLPAAWTSTVGFKPSYGSLSRYGVVSYASSLDTVGFIVGSSECAEIAWRCLKGDNTKQPTGYKHWDAQVCRDSTSRVYHASSRSVKKTLNETGDRKVLDGIRIGIPSAFSLHESPPLISALWSKSADLLQSKGATLVSIPESKVSSQWAKLSCAAYYVLACAEASSNLSRYDGVRYGLDCKIDEKQQSALLSEDLALSDMTMLEQQISATRVHGFGDEVQRRVLAGTSVLSSDRFHTHYEAAAVVRAKLSHSLDNVFRNSDDSLDGVDAILVPTALSFPVELGPGNGDNLDSTSAFANDVMTIPVSLGGFPSVSVPLCCSMPSYESTATNQYHDEANTPVGLQLFGPRGSDDIVLMVASQMG
jgi:aspartyl-tRNA(Asn)/glutamyl-tRNA(Gln) amidotransferase subunit A